MNRILRPIKNKTRHVFSGTHSTGKSTLINFLIESYFHRNSKNISVVNEVARTVLRRGLPMHFESTIETYLAIIDLHMQKELSFNSQLVFLDRCLIDYAAYALVNGNCSSSLMNIFKNCNSLLQERSDLSLYFYLPIEFPMALDGERLENEDYRKKADKAILYLLKEWNIPYFTLTGSVRNRASQFTEIIKNLEKEYLN